MMHERARARWQVEVLKRRLEEANKSLQADPLVRAEEIKKLRRVVRDKDREIKDLQKKVKHTEGLVKEASKKETALKKRNEELKSAKEELMKGVVARDEVNIQYVERLLAAEKMLAKSNGGEEFVALQDRLKKDREKRERARKDMQEENDLLRRLNEALSIKIKDLEDPASPTKKLTSKVDGRLTSQAVADADAAAVDECPICLMEIDMVSDPLAVLRPCGHIFHEVCVASWIAKKPFCPTCRHPTDRFHVL